MSLFSLVLYPFLTPFCDISLLLPLRPAFSDLGLPLGPQPWATSQAGHLPGLDSTVLSHLGYVHRHYLYANHYLKEMCLGIVFATFPFFSNHSSIAFSLPLRFCEPVVPLAPTGSKHPPSSDAVSD